MFIFTPENRSYDTALISDHTLLHYCIVDFSDQDDVDYRFPPLVLLEDYPKASAEIKIGNVIMQAPFDWEILVGDFLDLELIPLHKFRGLEFNAFIFNPLTGYLPEFIPVEITNYYREVRWAIPTIKANYMLAVPLTNGENPLCAFFAEPKNKIPDPIQMKDMF